MIARPDDAQGVCMSIERNRNHGRARLSMEVR
jgi:hypothetical protein